MRLHLSLAGFEIEEAGAHVIIQPGIGVAWRF
jgi:hypothetical protein